MGIPRKEKICPKCRCFREETERVAAECDEDENIYSSEYCESFDAKED